MKYLRTLVLFLALPAFSGAQSLADLVYSLPVQDKSYTYILPLGHRGYKVVVGDVLYLLNSNNLIVDTLTYLDKKGEQLLTCFQAGPALFSLNTYSKGLLIAVADNSFQPRNTVFYNTAFRKKLKKEHQLEARPGTVNLLPQGLLLNTGPGQYTVLYNEKTKTIDLAKYALIDSPYRNRIFANNYLFIGNNQLAIWNQFNNVLTLVNLPGLNTTLMPIALPDSVSEVNQVYFDQSTGAFYLWAWKSDSLSRLFRLDMTDNSYRLVRDNLPYIVRDIADSKMYVIAPFDGLEGHYFIPIWGQSKPVEELKNVEIDH